MIHNFIFHFQGRNHWHGYTRECRSSALAQIVTVAKLMAMRGPTQSEEGCRDETVASFCRVIFVVFLQEKRISGSPLIRGVPDFSA